MDTVLELRAEMAPVMVTVSAEELADLRRRAAAAKNGRKPMSLSHYVRAVGEPYESGGTQYTGKGTLSVRGLAKFPLSLYPEQWVRLAEYIPTVLAAIVDAQGLAYKHSTPEQVGARAGALAEAMDAALEVAAADSK